VTRVDRRIGRYEIRRVPLRAATIRPRITRARLSPSRVVKGRRSSLRVTLAAPARMHVVLERTRNGRHVRVRTFNVAARGRSLSLRLPASLRTGRYRVRIVAIDAQGNQSTESRRSLTVVRRSH
jgi:hypothetical protein